MSFSDILNGSRVWFGGGPACPIAVSSRVRLARNLRDSPFPGHASEDARDRVWRDMEPVLRGMRSMRICETSGYADLSELDRLLLFERHLISREHAAKTRGSGVAIRRDAAVSVMVNEEDHLRLQAFRVGLDVRDAWRLADEVDTEIQSAAPIAFDSRWGYLTACPSNVGTGLRASVMLHLAGLVLMEEMAPVIHGIQKIGLAVRGVWGEGTEASGNLFQISNQMTLGETEDRIVATLEQVALELVEHERNARARLRENRQTVLRDHVGRARGILERAHILSSKEALDLLSALRLGIDAGILKGVDRTRVDEMLLLAQPAHLQGREGRELDSGERDAARAALIRAKLFSQPSEPERNESR